MRTTDDFFAALWNKREKAIQLTPKAIRYRDGSQPVAGQCHENVDRWVGENPDYEAMRGWIPMRYGFERHSVLRDPSGRLVDITLKDSYLFLVHDNAHAPFDWFAEKGFNQVYWPKV